MSSREEYAQELRSRIAELREQAAALDAMLAVLQESSRPRGILWRMNDLFMRFSWSGEEVRVEWLLLKLLRDVSSTLKSMHAKGLTYGPTLGLGNIFLQDVGAGGAVMVEARIRRANISSKQCDPFSEQHTQRVRLDMICLGIVILETLLRRPVRRDTKHFPNLLETLRQERERFLSPLTDWTASPSAGEVAGSSSNSRRIPDDEEEDDSTPEDDPFIRIAAIEQEIRGALQATEREPWYQSMTELCVQCCGFPENRPDATSVWDWIDGVLADMHVSPVPFSVNEFFSSHQLQFPKLVPVHGYIDLYSHTGQEIPDFREQDPDDEENESSCTLEPGNGEPGTGDESGYDTDDSFLPPAPQVKRRLNLDEGPKSTLLRKSSSSVVSASDMEARPNKLSSFITEVSSQQQHPQPRLRRSSTLDDEEKTAAAAVTQSVTVEKKRAYKPVSSSTRSNFKDSWQRLKARKNSRTVPGPAQVAERFDRQERLSEDEAQALVFHADAILRQEPNIMEVAPPVVVIGDIHGQYFDFRQMMRDLGIHTHAEVQPTLIFLGDYVDRGAFSCEVLLYALSLKVSNPTRTILLRGNHECSAVSSYFGFKDECEAKYGRTIFHRFLNCFQAMPIAAIVPTSVGRFFCCHGGISPNVQNLKDVEAFPRFVDPGMNGLLCDLLWADPMRKSGTTGSGGSPTTPSAAAGEDATTEEGEFSSNPARGCSYKFGKKALARFLKDNDLRGIIRAHEVLEKGYFWHFRNPDIPMAVTIFSAPNYCGRYGNLGAFLTIADEEFLSPPPKHLDRDRVGPLTAYLFPAVESQPTPLEFEPVNKHVNKRIEETCPYMPTTLHEFIKFVISTADARLRREDSSGSMGSPNDPLFVFDVPQTPPPSSQKSLSFHTAKGKINKAIKKVAALKAMTSPRHFDTAAASDSINEIHPTLMMLRLDSAQLQLRLNKKKVAAAAAAAASAFLSSPERKRNSNLAKHSPPSKSGFRLDDLARKVERETLAQEQHQQGSSSVSPKTMMGARRRLSSMEKSLSPPSTSPLTSGLLNGIGAPSLEIASSQITFSEQELHNLQILFIMIDRTADGFISVDELVQWSNDEGETISREEAEACVRAADADGDHCIGLEDFLQVAANAKEIWLETHGP